MRIELRLFLLILCFYLCKEAEGQINCRALQQNLIENGSRPEVDRYPCSDLCTGSSIVDETSCSDAEHCWFDNITNSCFLKQLTNASVSEVVVSENQLGENFLETYNNEARSLSLFNSADQFALFFPDVPVCLKFPANCNITYTSPEALQPPVNIPYCQRLPCRADNPFLEIDPQGCLTTPGCYFDYSLFFYRNVLGFIFLPAVPVCHLAVRNKIFLENATQYAEETKAPWNPLLTECLIDELQDEIFTESNGCAKLRVLQQLGYHAKSLGWKSISSRECNLLDGCWLENRCYYSLTTGNIKTDSENDASHVDFLVFGRPECLPIENGLTNAEFLDGYHTCLRSGCYTDASPNDIALNLIGVATNSLPPHLQHQFLTLVLSGHARADNYRHVFDQLISLDALLPTSNQTSSPEGRSSRTDNLNLNSRTLTVTSGTGSLTDIQAMIQKLTIDTDNRLGLGLIDNFDLRSSRFDLPCPYQAISWPNFPPLLGSFDGCCETSFCYLPRSVIRTAHSEIASYNTSWSFWSSCSVTCGLGVQTRRKFCIGEICRNIEQQEQQPCSPGACPVRLYSPWSGYSSCSVTCGGGVKVRQRSCMVSGECEDELRETISCNTGRCSTFRYGQWSRCSRTCGFGIQRRYLKCEHPGDYGCPANKYEQRECERFCGHIRFINSRCNLKTCLIARTAQCVQGDGRSGHCRPSRSLSSPVTTKCYEGRCRCFHHPNRHECKKRRTSSRGR